MNRYFYLVALCLFFVISKATATNNDDYIIKTASEILSQKIPETIKTRAVTTYVITDTISSTAYVVKRNDGAFALISTNNNLPSVLGYGTKTSSSQTPESLVSLFNKYHIASANGRATRLLTTSTPVLPLLESIRTQSSPFNNACPYYYTDGKPSEARCLVGCVATSLEQIMTYYKHPKAIIDTLHGWSTEHYTINDVLPGTPIDWNNILNIYKTSYTPEQAKAVADLSYWCGIATQMQWKLDASGTNVYKIANQVNKSFGYGFTKYLDSYNYRTDEWISMMISELMANRPILYAGYTSFIGGHAFVVDGINEDGLFHINWGYGGAYDGYFALDILWPFANVEDGNPEAMGFFCNQEAFLMYPKAISPNLPDSIHKNGNELRIDSLKFTRTPDLNDYVTLQLYATNTTNEPLTTSMEFLTNAPSDTEIFKQADFVALSGIRLQANESGSVKVRCQFQKWGNRIFSISADDSTFIWKQEINIDSTAKASLSYGALDVVVKGTNILGIQNITNAKNCGWAGNMIQYYVCEGENLIHDQSQFLISYINIAPGEQANDSIRFVGLKPYTTYTLWTTLPQQIKQHTTFRTGAKTGINSPHFSTDIKLFDLNGKKITDKQPHRGIFIQKSGNTTMKIISH